MSLRIIPLNHKEILREIGIFASRRGLPLWCVGGCARDWFLGIKNKDLDIVCGKNPAPLVEFCLKKWGGKSKKFDEFGTFRVFLANGLRLDFVRARSEAYPEPASLPEVFPGSLAQDLKRRDFTVNAVAVGMLPDSFGQVIDLFGGISDVKKGLIRVLHERSFIDDPTRLYRAARFAGRLGWKPNGKTKKLISEAVRKGCPALLSRERLKNELWRILEEKDPSRVFSLMKGWGLLKFLHPGLKWSAGASSDIGPAARLGVLASGIKDGLQLLESLNLERPVFQQLKHAVEMVNGRCCSRAKLTELERSVILHAAPGLPKYAFSPLFVDGNDLKKAGVPPGKEYSRILDFAAKAQWKGLFSSRKSAFKWVKKQFPAVK